tara:strand:- start:1486 stop:2847 length:1362 start_codon:yes stop_codon:yes gene_type:complete
MLDIVVLAAGKGTRMKSDQPKVLHTIAGKPMLSHVLDTARKVGADNLNVVIGHGSELVEQTVAASDVKFVMQTEQLGTGHAVQQVEHLLRDDAVVIILCGDVPLIKQSTLTDLVAQVSANSMGLLTLDIDNATGYGRIVRDHNGEVIAIVEHKDATCEQLEICEINTGVMAFKGSHLKAWLHLISNKNSSGEYYLTDMIAIAHEKGIAIATAKAESEMEVLGVNNRMQQAMLERHFQQSIAEDLMVNGVTMMDPMRFDCRGSIAVGRDVHIDVNCVFEGEVKLGNGVVVGPNCVIKNAVIGDNTVIKANSMIDDATVANDCEVGPYARLRPGTELQSGVKIGNFVETKKAVIGVNSKVNHLSYVGDTVVGSGCNLGAGVITCNYDGANKFKTEIGNNVFVGTNTALVAPVTLADGSTTGAGSVISNSVGKNQLAVSRAKQRNIDGWVRPSKKH